MFEEKNYKEKSKILVKRLLIATAILLIIFLTKQMVVQYQINREGGMATVINVAGRQRMLSQKIMKGILFLQNGDMEKEKETMQVLQEDIDLWVASHYNLVHGNEEEGIPENKSQITQALFEEIQPVFQEMLEDVRVILLKYQTVAGEKRDTDDNLAKIEVSEKQYLSQMDEIVCNYEQEAEQSLRYLEMTHIVLFSIMITIMIYLFLQVFRPGLKELQLSFFEINETNENIKKMFATMKGAIFIVTTKGDILFRNQDAKALMLKACTKMAENQKQEFEDLPVEKGNIIQCINWSKLNMKRILEKVEQGESLDGIEAEIEVDSDRKIEAGQDRTISVVLSAMQVGYKAQSLIMINLFDISFQKKSEQELQKKVNRDELTGLYNRHFLDSIIHEEIDRSERYEIPLSAILLDLDHFKKVNDRWGHPIGDSVLQLTAELVLKHTRMSDYAIRIGGEEFLILMPHTNITGAMAAAENIRRAIEEAIHPVTGKFTASFGVAERTKGETYRSVYKRVDDALYEAKENGRNCVVKSESPQKTYASISLKWKNTWNCGEPNIDEQHRELFRMASRLANTTALLENPEKMLQYLDKILLHVSEHFEYEERALEKIDYEDINRHKRIHAFLLEKAGKMRNSLAEGSVDEMKVFAFIFDDVIIGHLLSEDIKFHELFTRI